MKKNINDLNRNTEREIHDLGEHILLFQGFFSDRFCEQCIDTFNACEDRGLAFSRQDHNSGPSALSIQDKAVPIVNIPASSLPNVTELHDTIHNEIIPEFLKKYPVEGQYQHINLGGAKLQKTEPTQGYHVWHMEHSNQMDSYRSICAWGLFLNDVEEGGELEFLYQSQRIKPKRGDFVLWPAGYTHQHRGNPPISGTKYIYTGWLDTL